VFEGNPGLDEVLEMLDRTTKRLQNLLEETKTTANKQATAYAQALQASTATQEQKIKIFISRNLELDRIDRLSSQLSLLYALQIFAFKVKVLEVSVGNMNEQLTKSGLMQKSGELEDIKKNIDALKILVEAQYEAMKQVREDQNKTLNYIH
jgi:archaellum component FlaC